jgi:hypothetical protein
MLPVSLDCPCLLPLRYSLTFICPVSRVPYVASFSGLSLFITPPVFSNIYLPCVSCTLGCQFLWIVLVYYPSVISNMYLPCVSCNLCCPFLRLVLVYYPFRILLHLFSLCLVQINVREYRRGNKQGQSRETGNIAYTRHRTNT